MSRIWTPRADQQQVLDFGMPKDKWALFGPPGCGKTSIAGAWATNLMYAEMALPRLLIIAPPMVARDNWPALRQWSQLQRLAGDMRVLQASDFNLTPRAMVISDDEAWECLLEEVDETTKWFCDVSRMGLDFRDRASVTRRLLSYRERVHVVSKPFFPWLVKAWGTRWPYQGVIYDESSGLRDGASEQTKSMRKVVHSLKKKVAVDFLLELTGSPNSNHGPAIFPQIDLIAPGLLAKNITEFRERWCQPDVVNRQTGDVHSWKIVPALQDQLAALVARVAVSVPSSLQTPLVEADVACPPSEAQIEAYDKMCNTSVLTLPDGQASAANAGVLHAKKRQIASGFVFDDNEQVLQISHTKMDQIIEDATEYEGQVLFAFQFKEEARRLKAVFGDRIADIRERGAREAFMAGRLRWLMLHPASAGHGVDGLQHTCNQLWWTSVPDDRELYDQANARVHRHGTQAQSVYVRRYFTPGTIEERIKDEVLPGKLSVSELLLQGTRIGGIVGPL